MPVEMRMGSGKDGVDLEVGKPGKPETKFIEWNVDMNMRVTVSNAKRSKMYQRSRNILVVVMVIAFAILLSHLRREVRALQVQMQTVNVNLLVLMSKYDRLNRNLNRTWLNRLGKQIGSPIRAGRSYEKATERSVAPLVGDEHAQSFYASSPINPSPLNSSDALSEKLPFSNATNSTYEPGYRAIDQALTETRVKNVNFRENRKLRVERAILNFEARNSTTGEMPTESESVENDDETDESAEYSSVPRAGRSRRDEGRGKKRGPLVATFVGAIPEQHITDSVYVGPWVKTVKNNSQYNLNKFHLVEDKKSIEVTASGLYIISAQVFYFGEPSNYSYWILLTSEGKSNTQKLVKCATASATTATEASCYSSIIVPLRKGDRIHVQQQERNRLINMREGHSFIQLVLLSPSGRKRREA